MAVNPTKVLIIDDSDVPPTPDRLPAYCPRCGVRYVGKESNRLDEVEHGLVHSLDEVQATYEDPSLDLWPEVIVPILKQRTAAVWARETGCSARTVKASATPPANHNPRTVTGSSALLTAGPRRRRKRGGAPSRRRDVRAQPL